MLALQRRVTTLGMLGEQTAVRVEDLAARTNASLSTIRRDLAALEREGLVRRVHGGAVLVPAPDEPELPPVAREIEHRADKHAIAKTAVTLVEPDTTVLLSGGTTTAALAPLLRQVPNLTVVTNSLDIAHTFATDDIQVIVLGGVLRRPELSLLGHLVELSLQEIQVDHAVMGVYGLNARHGMLGASGQETGVDRSLARSADRLTVLADASKFSRRSPHRIAPAEKLTDLVVGNDAPAEEIAGFEAKGVNVHLVDVPGSADPAG